VSQAAEYTKLLGERLLAQTNIQAVSVDQEQQELLLGRQLLRAASSLSLI